jgi:peptidoglycan/LPS O-acetylase OafA/YrhL
MRTRDSNLDLLRAAAILMVVVYHVAQRWPVALPRLTAFTQYGEYGVDLFFVLSGWLIGGLLWREHEKFGNVQIVRFICRRALRTVPPYLVALAIFYAGVFVARHEPFDWGYLLFLQNYYQNISYFHISWSLCVEEHFYLVMPVIVLAISTRIGRAHTLLLVPALFPVFFRALAGDAFHTQDFGYYRTATHLRYEGLLLGVWASFLFQKHSDAWRILRRIAPFALGFSLAALIGAAALGDRGRYIFFYFTVALTFLFLLVCVAGRKPLPFADSRVVLWIASASYSVYLTHTLALAAALNAAGRSPSLAAIHLLTVSLLITVAGALFYVLIERSSLALRHRLMPGRTHAPSPLRAPLLRKRN